MAAGQRCPLLPCVRGSDEERHLGAGRLDAHSNVRRLPCRMVGEPTVGRGPGSLHYEGSTRPPNESTGGRMRPAHETRQSLSRLARADRPESARARASDARSHRTVRHPFAAGGVDVCPNWRSRAACSRRPSHGWRRHAGRGGRACSLQASTSASASGRSPTRSRSLAVGRNSCERLGGRSVAGANPPSAPG